MWPRIEHKAPHYVTNGQAVFVRQRNDRLLKEKSERRAQSWAWQPYQTVSLEGKDITDLFIFISLPLIFNFGSLSIDGVSRAYIITLAALRGEGISFLTPIQYDLRSWSFTLSSQKQNRGRIYCITDVKLHPHNALFMAWINVFRWSWVGSVRGQSCNDARCVGISSTSSTSDTTGLRVIGEPARHLINSWTSPPPPETPISFQLPWDTGVEINPATNLWV